jgi:hypothetical protein
LGISLLLHLTRPAVQRHICHKGGVRGCDAGKYVVGRKRHLLVETTLELILEVVVSSAAVPNRDGARGLLVAPPMSRWLVVDSPAPGTRIVLFLDCNEDPFPRK